jgi:alanyl-tRNA synthetase
LETGIERLKQIIQEHEGIDSKVVHGKQAFELFDTYGFPLDLTQLIVAEKGLSVNTREFNEEMQKQKDRSRAAAEQEISDWVIVMNDDHEEFIGYDHLASKVRITQYRQITRKKKNFYQLVFNYTPFYAESGGQVGDQGYLEQDGQKIAVVDTQKENNLIIHVTESLPRQIDQEILAQVSPNKRKSTMRNHTATHLLHHCLRQILGEHVEQKGSLVTPDHFRFDFSHYEKLTPEILLEIETCVNRLIRENISLDERREVPMPEAREMGAVALFGEKYGDLVRVIKFGDSVELCGGTHVKSTGEIGFFKITSEGSIAAGIRRIEALTGEKSESYIQNQLALLNSITELFKNTSDIADSIRKISEENSSLKKEIEKVQKLKVKQVKSELISQAIEINGVRVIKSIVEFPDAGAVKDLLFQIRGEMDNTVAIVGIIVNGKPNLSIMITDDLVSSNSLDAGKIVREAAKKMQGGGGGQAFFASAGGKNPNGLQDAIDEAYNLIFK